MEDAAELNDDDAAWRIVARGSVDICDMGRVPGFVINCAPGDGRVLATNLGRGTEQV